MKILLVAINAKYIHSNLAVYSLRAYAKKNISNGDPEIEIAEYTINQQQDEILRDIYEKKADVVCFSCYIWNLSYVEALVCELGKICPDSDIWMGGPEVSYDAKKVLERLWPVKGVMMGEGERTFLELCERYTHTRINIEKDDGAYENDLEKIAGITFRKKNGSICEN